MPSLFIIQSKLSVMRREGVSHIRVEGKKGRLRKRDWEVVSTCLAEVLGCEVHGHNPVCITTTSGNTDFALMKS